ncbi:acyl-CoA dehydrogenase family protein [Hyphomonas oceanitis]|uniref:Acyl-CoA dehydrogenase family protein n=1 Tax=Hyphomonas oceanitis SCH89 TaxID=1280953 RepID=A0A059G570_9PROT|nr:acyl-CoA dehydrogenase family protein [Hyphomonas oceanitis]KDA01982.1 acyl-CoA dehydrogenase family protein [Hyphomonas oceanitis SCH89]
MEFALSEDQRMLQDSLSGFLKDAAPLDTIRKIATGDKVAADALVTGLDDFGLSGLHVAEDHGGLGLGLLDACLVQEALGYAIAPSRFMATTVTAHALRHAGDAHLPAIVAGEMRMGLALTELSSRRDGAGVTAEKGRLSGTSLLALSAEESTHMLVADAAAGLHIVETPDNVSMQTIDRTRVFSEVRFAGEESEVSLKPDDEALAVARLLAAADTLGAAQAMIDKAVAYAAERQQFGRVIGSFQAVKHMCAEMAARLEPSRALIWHAAHALDTGEPEGLVMATLAKSHLAEAGTFIARTSTEVHGGMGFTDLVGLHYWFKRIGANRQLFGSPEQCRMDAARLQGWLAA